MSAPILLYRIGSKNVSGSKIFKINYTVYVYVYHNTTTMEKPLKSSGFSPLTHAKNNHLREF